jgi:hypothetical protein
MPLYDYETIPASPDTPVRRLQVQQRMSEAPLTHDPASGEPVRRIISGGLGTLIPSRGSSEAPAPAPMAGGCGTGCGCVMS